MLKLTRALLWVVVVGSLLVGVASASYWVYSHVIDVTVTNYNLSLTETHDGLSISLSGILKDPFGTPISGVSVEVYRTDSGGGILEPLASPTTDVDGNYAYDWLAPSDGIYYFKSGYETPA